MKRIQAVTLGFAPGSELKRVRPGTILEVPDDFKGNWFKVLDSDKPEPKAKKQAPVALSEIAKQQAKGPTDPIA